MTRKEEIRKAADTFIKNFGCKESDAPLLSAYYLGYIEGAEWSDAHQPSPWISVEDRLPEKVNKFFSDFMIVMYTRGGKPYPFITRYDYECGIWEIDNVTHWMPIPELKTTK